MAQKEKLIDSDEKLLENLSNDFDWAECAERDAPLCLADDLAAAIKRISELTGVQHYGDGLELPFLSVGNCHIEMEYIRQNVAEKELLAMLAEKASALAQIALELRRPRSDNDLRPYKRPPELSLTLVWGEVLNCVDLLHIYASNEDRTRRIQRMAYEARMRGARGYDLGLEDDR